MTSIFIVLHYHYRYCKNGKCSVQNMINFILSTKQLIVYMEDLPAKAESPLHNNVLFK